MLGQTSFVLSASSLQPLKRCCLWKNKKNRYFSIFQYISKSQISKYKYLQNTNIHQYIDISQQPITLLAKLTFYWISMSPWMDNVACVNKLNFNLGKKNIIFQHKIFQHNLKGIFHGKNGNFSVCSTKNIDISSRHNCLQIFSDIF